MPTLPTPPWAMEEPLLLIPSEILVAGGDAPPWPGGATVTGDQAGADAPGQGAEPPAIQDVARDAILPDVTRMAGDNPADASPATTEEAGTMPAHDASTPAGDVPASHQADEGAVPAGDAPEPPAEDVPFDDAFPSLAALDAIRAAFATDPPGPDEAARAEFAALLGLDPALAAEEEAFLDALRDAPAPDGDALLVEWLSAAVAAEPGPWTPAADWPFP